MRDVFHDELDEIGAGVAKMTELVAVAMEQATGALLDADLARAERVIDADQAVDDLRVDLEDRAFQMIARQQPVATDLRVLVTTLHLVADLERMGDLALHVAKIARLRFPEAAVPQEARDVIAQMGDVAHSLVRKVGDVVGAGTSRSRRPSRPRTTRWTRCGASCSRWCSRRGGPTAPRPRST